MFTSIKFIDENVKNINPEVDECVEHSSKG
jgi:hypothetical protein